MKRLFPPETLLFLGLWLVLMVGGQARFFRDPGTFWHVAVGQRLLQVGFFDTDPYSFTKAGERWIPHQWLGEGAMAIVYNALGDDGLLVLATAFIAALFTGIGLRFMHSGWHLSVTSVLLASGLAASALHFHVRPHLATMMGMAVTMVFLTDIEAKRIPVRRAWWLVPIFWMWANCHGGVLGGLATLLFVGAGWFLAYCFRRESPLQSLRDLGQLTLVFLACLLACVANPYTYRLPEAWLQIYRMETLPELIAEHGRLSWHEPSGLMIVGFAVFYLLLFVGVLPRLRIAWLVPVVWLVLAYTRIRHAPLFAIVALVALADFLPYTRYARFLLKKQSDLYRPAEDMDPPAARDEAALFKVPAVVLGVALLLQVLRVPVPVLGSGWARPDPTVWPTELLPELKKYERRRSTGTRIFNDFNYGGLLILHTPGYRVFVDDRCELYGDAFLANYTSARYLIREGVLYPASCIDEWEAQYGAFDMALVESEGPFDYSFAVNPGDWDEVKRTPTATLYRRRD